MAQTITGASYTDENIKNLQAQLDKTKEQLANYNTSAATDEALRQQATNEYTPIYNAQVQEQEAAKESAQNALNSQLSALDRQYARDSEALVRSYDNQRVSANNTMLARGFNNSSLAAALLNHVETERGRALQNLQTDRAANETSAQNAYNSAIAAADKAIGRLGTDLQTNIDARYQALKDADAERVFQAQQAQNALTQYVNDLMLQIEQLRQQGYSQYLQAQKKSSSSSSSSAGSTPQNTSTPPSSLADQYNNSGNQTSASEVGKTLATAAKKGASTIASAAKTLLNSLSSKKTSSTSSNNVLYDDGSMRPAGRDS